jgi:hypothetical protein
MRGGSVAFSVAGSLGHEHIFAGQHTNFWDSDRPPDRPPVTPDSRDPGWAPGLAPGPCEMYATKQ